MSSDRSVSKLGLTIILLVVLSVIAAFFLRRDQDEALPRFTTAEIERGEIVEAVNTTGVLSPLVSVEVSSQISGLVTEVNVDFNSQVKKGDVLATIDPSTYEQQLRQAEANLAAAQASFKLAELNDRRLHGLREKDLVTQQEYDQAAAELQQAEATLLTRQATVDNARLDLERCTITSPIEGIVLFKEVQVGKTVVSNFSAPTLFVIAQDLSKMRIIAPISEVDIWKVQAGQPVTFTVDAIPDRRFTGRLTQIRNPYTPSDAQQDQSSQQSTITTFDAVIEVDNADLVLRPSLTANVSVIVERREDVLMVPNGALRVDLPAAAMAAPAADAAATAQAEQATVYRLPAGGGAGTAPEAVSVQLGISDSIVTEVQSGLEEGDRVVTGTVNEWEPRRRSTL